MGTARRFLGLMVSMHVVSTSGESHSTGCSTVVDRKSLMILARKLISIVVGRKCALESSVEPRSGGAMGRPLFRYACPGRKPNRYARPSPCDFVMTAGWPFLYHPMTVPSEGERVCFQTITGTSRTRPMNGLSVPTASLVQDA